MAYAAIAELWACCFSLLSIKKGSDYRGHPVRTITISLPDSLRQFVEGQIGDKGFGNVSEYFRSLLRDAQAKDEEARLEKLLLEGLASKRIPLDDKFRTRLAKRVDEILERRDKRDQS